jgi:FkbM family methyltransferase
MNTPLAVRALRRPGPYVPGWFPLVVERLDPIVGPARGEQPAVLLGSRIVLDTREYMQRRFYYHCYEAPEARFLERWLRPGDGVADVGAHVGFFTLLSARLVGANGSVSAFEPIPATFARLRDNVAANGYDQVSLVEAAVTDAPGHVSLGFPQERLVGYSTSDYSIGADIGAIEAAAVTLDEALADRPPLRLLKIDAEGAERQVLDGARTLLQERPPEAILLEVNHQMLGRHGSAGDDVLGLLESFGYRIRALRRNGRPCPAPTAEQLRAAGERADAQAEGRSQLRIGLATRHTMFNAVALR